MDLEITKQDIQDIIEYNEHCHSAKAEDFLASK